MEENGKNFGKFFSYRYPPRFWRKKSFYELFSGASFYGLFIEESFYGTISKKLFYGGVSMESFYGHYI
jgi:hypothetical protein